PHVTGAVHDVIGPTVLAVLFTALLSLFLSQRATFGISDANVFSVLGKYTYGLYLYHLLAINLLIRVLAHAGFNTDFLPDGLLLLLSLALSIPMPAPSYYWFELPFLALKKYARPPAVSSFAPSSSRS